MSLLFEKSVYLSIILEVKFEEKFKSLLLKKWNKNDNKLLKTSDGIEK
jgi:hypothetical protein